MYSNPQKLLRLETKDKIMVMVAPVSPLYSFFLLSLVVLNQCPGERLASKLVLLLRHKTFFSP